MKKHIALLFLTTLFISCTHHQVPEKKAVMSKDAAAHGPDTLKPPQVTLLETCPPPLVVPIPTRPGTLVKQTEKGKQTIPLSQPQHKIAGFYAPMTSYTPQQGLYSSVSCIKKDNAGNLWFGSMGGGVCRYDGKTFTTYTTAQGLAHNEVMAITEDHSGNMWFATTSGGVSCFDGGKFTTYTERQGLASNYLASIITDNRHRRFWR